MWSVSNSANVDIHRRLHGILRFFNNSLKKSVSIQNVCLPFYDFQCQTRRRSNCFRYQTGGLEFNRLVGVHNINANGHSHATPT